MKLREVIVIGGANLDIKCRLSGALIKATSNIGDVSTSAGGVGRNIAENLARLGVPVALLTAIGRDADGDQLVKDCRSTGIDVTMIERLDQPTGRYVAVLDSGGELVLGVNAMAITDAVTPELVERHRQRLMAAETLIADANLPEATLTAIAGLTNPAKCQLVIDPVSVEKCRRLLPLLDAQVPIALLSPNRDQLAELTGRLIRTEIDIREAVGQLHTRGVINVIVGLGPNGAYASDGAAGRFIPARAAMLVDVTGAGDAALAAAVFALQRGMNLFDAARAGQIAAGITAECASTAAPNLNVDLILDQLAADGA